MNVQETSFFKMHDSFNDFANKVKITKPEIEHVIISATVYPISSSDSASFKY